MIIPSIDLQNAQAVQLVQGKQLKIQAGDPIPIAKQFRLAGEIAVIDLDAAMGKGSNAALIEQLIQIAPCRVGGGIRDAQTARAWLNKGAAKIILGTAARPELLSQLPKDRVIAALDCVGDEVMHEGWQVHSGNNLEQQIEKLKPFVSGFLITFIENEGRMTGIDLERVARLIALAPECQFTFAGGITTPEHVAAIDKLGACSQVGMALYTSTLDLGDAIGAPLVSDRADGLIPTVVTDEQGVALGLVYSSRESIRESVRTGFATYQSRKRGLWVKGATSNNRQELLRIDLDCDRDTARFVVRQLGEGFCHKPSWSCLGQTSEISSLYRRIADRMQSSPTGSYSNRLAKDPALLGAKLKEEAAELADATDSNEVRHEAADLLYFMLVACAKQGVSLADLETELRSRDLQIERRQGDKKTDVAAIIQDLERRGETALLEWGEKFGDIKANEPYMLTRDALKQAFEQLSEAQQQLLQRVAQRIRAFAQAQKSCLSELSISVPGGNAGHDLNPVDTVGAYAPGGRYPLVSSVLMTVIPARVAGVRHICVATPRPQPMMLAAAYVAGADELLAVGGAQAIAAMAFGSGKVRRCDMIVGPGNRYVAAAKQHLFGRVGIDLIAGPSELLIIADDSANPEWVAADLLAQAEHDVDAKPMFVALSEDMLAQVKSELSKQVKAESVEARALQNGFTIAVSSIEEAVRIANKMGPEHLQLCVNNAGEIKELFSNYGGLFVGEKSAEVFCDYGFGPNHTLPTNGAARFAGGLSVFNFLRAQTYLQITELQDAKGAIDDARALAECEGLAGHARAAALRRLVRPT